MIALWLIRSVRLYLIINVNLNIYISPILFLVINHLLPTDPLQNKPVLVMNNTAEIFLTLNCKYILLINLTSSCNTGDDKITCNIFFPIKSIGFGNNTQICFLITRCHGNQQSHQWVFISYFEAVVAVIVW